jgi:Cu+-exporting ATPase
MPLAQIIVTLAGLAVIGFLAWYFFGPKKSSAALVKGNGQEIVVTVKGGYVPGYHAQHPAESGIRLFR